MSAEFHVWQWQHPDWHIISASLQFHTEFEHELGGRSLGVTNFLHFRLNCPVTNVRFCGICLNLLIENYFWIWK